MTTVYNKNLIYDHTDRAVCLQNVGRCWWCASPVSTQVGFVDVKKCVDAEGVTLTLP